MLFTINSLKLLLDWKDLEIKKILDGLTERGFEIESITEVKPQWSSLIVGKIISFEFLQNSDKLKLCQVFDGEKNCQVICGGPNLQANGNYIFAPVGSQVGPIAISERKIFGHLSQGMLCGWEEIGINLEGMTLIDDNFIPGTPIMNLNIFNDTIYDINVTPNRPDCLSLIGIAREVMAMDNNITWRPWNWEKNVPVTEDNHLNVTIDSSECTMFYTTILKNVTNYTPLWLKVILQDLGLKSINLPVDISNFLLKKYGYPSHCYTLSQLQNKTIKSVNSGTFLGLDHQQYTIDKPTLVLTNDQSIDCIMGIMGGIHSGYDGQGAIALEVANFNSSTIRSAVKNLKINSQAGYLFSRWVNPMISHWVIKDFIGLLAHYSPQLTISNTKNHCNNSINYEKISLWVPYELFYKMVGYELSLEKQMDHLKTLGFDCQLHKEPKNDGTDNYNLGIMVTPPHWRNDITIAENIVEEITRIHGVNQYESQVINKTSLDNNWSIQEQLWVQEQMMANFLIHRGYKSVINNSLTTESKNHSIKILQSEWALKTSLTGDIIKNATHSMDKGHKTFKLMESGTIFFYPDEEKIAISGLSYDFYGNQQQLFTQCRKDLENYGQLSLLFLEDGCVNDYYHPKKSCKIVYNNEIIGGIGVINSKILFNSPMVIWEIQDISKLKKVKEVYDNNYNLKSIDISFFTDEKINTIVNLLYKNFNIYQINIIDIYQGPQGNSYTLTIKWKYNEDGDKGEFMNQLTNFLKNNQCQVR